MVLSNAEFILLQIISAGQMVSGYEINQIIEERGYREWTDIGTTSIYGGLNKLNKKRLVTSYIDTEKQGRGPMPRKFAITPAGKDVLKRETLAALSSTRERDCRFDLALAAIPFLAKEEVIAALTSRIKFLTQVADNINQKLALQGSGKLPVNLQALYWHPLFLIKQEIEFINGLIQDLKKHQQKIEL